MNKELLFLCISLAFLAFSIITVLTAPIINGDNVNISNWGKLNCKFYYDKEEERAHIDEVQKMRKLKNLCYRQKAMFNLEYSSLTIDIVLGFIITQLGLLLYFKIGGSIKKITGIFGIIAGIICFILTLIYICFSGYIFNNDAAYKFLSPGNNPNYFFSQTIQKLFPNGALYKTGTPKIYPYQNDLGDDIEIIKYKNLGETQYNYNKKYYEAYNKPNPNPNCRETDGGSCIYVYKAPSLKIKNKYLYDNWVTSLFFGCLIIVCDLAIIIFGIILSKNNNEPELLIPNSETITINKK